MTRIERALHIARAEEGKGEAPRGSNWGGPVPDYLAAAGIRQPAPWCAAFVAWCLLRAGFDRSELWPTLAATRSLYVWARRAGRLSEIPARGTLFVWHGAGGGHTGFVAEVRNRTEFRTIEGNTNDEGSREGFEVAVRWRSVGALRRFPRWGFVRLA